jgi:hypothetical protein
MLHRALCAGAGAGAGAGEGAGEGEDVALASVEDAAAAWFDRKVFKDPQFDCNKYVADMEPYVRTPSRLPMKFIQMFCALCYAECPPRVGATSKPARGASLSCSQPGEELCSERPSKG